MELEKLKIYQTAMEIGREIWEIVDRLGPFEKNTLGYQVVRSADSIAANISEGEGMFHYGDKKRFLYYARGSAFETKT